MRGLLATMRNALAEAAAKRAALLSAMTIMIVNDAVWVVFWVLFFHRVGHLHGWDSRRVLLLLSVMTSAAGLTLGLLSNARRVGQMAVEGQLDSVLALPVQPLAFLLVRRVEPVNLGDLAFGITLFCIVGHPTPVHIVVYAAVVVLAAVLITGFLVLTGSIAFFAGRGEGSELGFHAILLLGSYPVDVFAGAAKVMLYTVVPAAFVSSVPARLILSFDATRAAWLVVVATFFGVAGTIAFTRGLRRYTSGAVWTRG